MSNLITKYPLVSFGIAIAAAYGAKKVYDHYAVNQAIAKINEIAKDDKIGLDKSQEVENLLKDIPSDRLNELNDDVIKKGLIPTNILFNLSLEQAKLLPPSQIIAFLNGRAPSQIIAFLGSMPIASLSKFDHSDLYNWFQQNLLSQEKYQKVNHLKSKQINQLAQKIKKTSNPLTAKKDWNSCHELLKKFPPHFAHLLSNDVIQLDLIKNDTFNLIPYLTYNQFLLLPKKYAQIICLQEKLEIATTKQEIKPFFQYLKNKGYIPPIGKKGHIAKAVKLDLDIKVSNPYIWTALDEKTKMILLKTGKVGGRLLRNLPFQDSIHLPEPNSLLAVQQSPDVLYQQFKGNKQSFGFPLLKDSFTNWAKEKLRQNSFWDPQKPLAVYAISFGKFQEWAVNNKSNDCFSVYMIKNERMKKSTYKINKFVAYRMAIMSKDYNVVVTCMKKYPQMVKDIKSASKKAKKLIQVLTFQGHRNANNKESIVFVPMYVDNAKQIQQKFLKEDFQITPYDIQDLKEVIAPKAAIVFEACTAGYPFGYKGALGLPGRTIISPNKPFNESDVIITSTHPYRISCIDCDDLLQNEIMQTFHV